VARFFRSYQDLQEENPMRLPVRVIVSCLLFSAAAPLGAQVRATQAFAPGSPASLDSALTVTDSTARGVAAAAASLDVGGAPLTGLRAGVHARETNRPDQPMLAPNNAHLGQARAMMIVGVAGLIAGALIGDTPGTIIMVGGAVIGLVGLYDYLQ
jgi:hypothetical protein